MALDFSLFGYAFSISWETVHSGTYTLILLAIIYLTKHFLLRGLKRQAKKRNIPGYHYKPMLQVINLILFVGTGVILIGIWGMQDVFYGLLAGAGFAGIVVGMAARDVIGNFLAGITLFFDRPFKIGDSVEIAGVTGKVKDISIRSTRLKTYDGLKVVLPSSKVVGSKIVNYSAYYRRKITIKLMVPVTADLLKAQSVIKDALTKDKKSDNERVYISSIKTDRAEFSAECWIDTRKTDLLDHETELSSEIIRDLQKNRLLG